MLMPVSETLIKRISRTFFEDGFVAALKVAAADGGDDDQHTLINWMARHALHAVALTDRFQIYFRPHCKESATFSIERLSPARNWSSSLVRFIAWHPNYFRIAVAACDDSIRVYHMRSGEDSSSVDSHVVPILKSNFQRSITSMSWRPFSAGELAVGCENGALVWQLDLSSQLTRPLSQAIHLKQ